MSSIPVIFVWVDPSTNAPIRKPALVPALPGVGDLLVPPGEMHARNVRAREWDCRNDRTVIYIALD